MEENLRVCRAFCMPRTGWASSCRSSRYRYSYSSSSLRNKRKIICILIYELVSPSAKLTLTTTMRIANNESFPLLLATQLNCFCMFFPCYSVLSLSLSLSVSLSFRCLLPPSIPLLPTPALLFDFALIWHFLFLLFVLRFIFFIFAFISLLLLFCFNSSLFAHNFSETCVRKQTNAWINTHWANDNEWMNWRREPRAMGDKIRGTRDERWVSVLVEKCKSQIQNTST